MRKLREREPCESQDQTEEMIVESLRSEKWLRNKDGRWTGGCLSTDFNSELNLIRFHFGSTN